MKTRRISLTGFLALMLLLPLVTVLPPVALSSQGAIQRLDAKGGLPGPPSEKPKPPGEEPQTYELFIEIDYMEGHKPTLAVLNYIKGYYIARGISITFYADYDDENGVPVDDPFSDMVPYDPYVDVSEFWVIENLYNDWIVYNDRVGDGDTDGDGYNEEFFLKEKWVLFGSSDASDPRIMGYTLAVIASINPKKADLLAGNYIFIADEAADTWADNIGVDRCGAEAVVLMHEIGHSIGIGIVQWSIWYGWVEVYDSDTFSVMSRLNVNNAGLYNNWYYSDKYWSTRNMQYYVKA